MTILYFILWGICCIFSGVCWAEKRYALSVFLFLVSIVLANLWTSAFVGRLNLIDPPATQDRTLYYVDRQTTQASRGTEERGQEILYQSAV